MKTAVPYEKTLKSMTNQGFPKEQSKNRQEHSRTVTNSQENYQSFANPKKNLNRSLLALAGADFDGNS